MVKVGQYLLPSGRPPKWTHCIALIRSSFPILHYPDVKIPDINNHILCLSHFPLVVSISRHSSPNMPQWGFQPVEAARWYMQGRQSDRKLAPFGDNIYYWTQELVCKRVSALFLVPLGGTTGRYALNTLPWLSTVKLYSSHPVWQSPWYCLY